ncbi:hypothetical protein [uncultured Enterobacter sp.]|uniref:hypothetical protein n=1 Tax=uncultured Enterobacter sp. TaxID=238202 RepID=UPI0025CF8E29|nr:hypothetical protein [uncultured Enterobacter sp.]
MSFKNTVGNKWLKVAILAGSLLQVGASFARERPSSDFLSAVGAVELPQPVSVAGKGESIPDVRIPGKISIHGSASQQKLIASLRQENRRLKKQLAKRNATDGELVKGGSGAREAEQTEGRNKITELSAVVTELRKKLSHREKELSQALLARKSAEEELQRLKLVNASGKTGFTRTDNGQDIQEQLKKTRENLEVTKKQLTQMSQVAREAEMRADAMGKELSAIRLAAGKPALGQSNTKSPDGAARKQ